MITDYFKPINTQPIITEYYELHRSFIGRNNFKKLYSEVKNYLQENSSRKSCVCMNEKDIDNFTIYSNINKINWTNTIKNFRDEILSNYSDKYSIDYGLVHYYHNEKSIINWHSDKEALKSNIYSISIGDVRRFCLRDKISKDIFTFDLFDGDMFVMKIGCQERYEHCIKSIKNFNKPRINITFRSIEKPVLFYTFIPENMEVVLTKEIPVSPNYKIITETHEKIIIGIINKNSSIDNKIVQKDEEIPISLIKSNLQKAIRRKNNNISLRSAMELIQYNKADELLRRLSIITFEDVCLTKYFNNIIWYYVAVTKGYILTEFDISFIYSYINLLCNIDITYDKDFINSIEYREYTISEILYNIDCISMYIRLNFGGFNGEKILIHKIIHCIKNHTINIYNYDIQLTKYKLYNEKLPILKCSIDFHCFPNMINKILSQINKTYENNTITEDDIKKYIWLYESSINYRENNKHEYSLEFKEIIKLNCDNYRNYIIKILDIVVFY